MTLCFSSDWNKSLQQSLHCVCVFHYKFDPTGGRSIIGLSVLLSWALLGGGFIFSFFFSLWWWWSSPSAFLLVDWRFWFGFINSASGIDAALLFAFASAVDLALLFFVLFCFCFWYSSGLNASCLCVLVIWGAFCVWAPSFFFFFLLLLFLFATPSTICNSSSSRGVSIFEREASNQASCQNFRKWFRGSTTTAKRQSFQNKREIDIVYCSKRISLSCAFLEGNNTLHKLWRRRRQTFVACVLVRSSVCLSAWEAWQPPCQALYRLSRVLAESSKIIGSREHSHLEVRDHTNSLSRFFLPCQLHTQANNKLARVLTFSLCVRACVFLFFFFFFCLVSFHGESRILVVL